MIETSRHIEWPKRIGVVGRITKEQMDETHIQTLHVRTMILGKNK